MNKKFVFFTLIASVLVSACDGDKYDGLRVVDGEGNVYVLEHSIYDVYFVMESSAIPKTPVERINEKLEKKLNEKETNQ